MADGLITLAPSEGEPLQTTWIIVEGEDSVIVGGQPGSASQWPVFL